MTSSPEAPYNPWLSYLVEASAGSGKTWQLSRRFLALVVAGADPSSILTVTFTKKAAAEMRGRIIQDAVKMGQNNPEFSTFQNDVLSWAPKSKGLRLRSNLEASKLIVERTQTLKITTIDSLFIQWSQRFPWETSIQIDGSALTAPWALQSNLDILRMQKKAWNIVLSKISQQEESRIVLESIAEHSPDGLLKKVSTAIAPLSQCDTFLWYASLLNGGNDCIKYFEVEGDVDREETFLEQNSSLFSAVLGLISNPGKRELAFAALSARDLNGLVKNSVISSDHSRLNGNTFKSAQTRSDSRVIELSQKLLARSNLKKLTLLNKQSKLIWTLFKARSIAEHALKIKECVGTFSDAAKGVSLLARDEDKIGGRAMAWSSIRHLMLDEFQDTSRLQWMIFEILAKDLLSGHAADSSSDLNPSVFIVGDKKQSIYRFREAAPEVVDLARDTLKPLGLVARQMSRSYRSATLILDLVNKVFEDGDLIADFPQHSSVTKIDANGNDLNEYGTIHVYPPCLAKNDDSGELSAIEHEAQTVADHIRKCIDGDISMSIFDATKQSWRRPTFSDFAILYPASTNSRYFEDALRNRQIPARKLETKGFFERREIQDLNALVTWLTWPADSLSLCTILKSPLCSLLDNDLQKVLKDGADKIWMNLESFYPETTVFLSELRATNFKTSMTSLVGKLLTLYKIDQKYETAFGPIEGPLARANIIKWFDLIRQGSADDALASFTWEKTAFDASEEDEIGNAIVAADCVSMMTIHKSKGLEFPCVIITGTGKDWHRAETGWVKDSRSGHESVWYIGRKDDRPSENPQLSALLKISEIESRQEKARLLYVALTRATHHLVVTGSKTKDESAFLELIQRAANGVKGNTIQNSTSDSFCVMRTLAPETNRPSLPSSTSNDIPKIDPVLPQHISQPLKILTPSKMKTSNLAQSEKESFRTETRFDPKYAAIFGTIVHKVLENRIRGLTWNIENYHHFCRSKSDVMITSDLAVRLVDFAFSEVEELLISPAWKKITDQALNFYPEVSMAMTEKNQLIHGTADLIIEDSVRNFSVVDYKTIPIDPKDALTIIHRNGFDQQVKIYCQLVAKAKSVNDVKAFVLFTNPPQLVQVT